MGKTVAGATAEDANIADYVRDLIGVDSISTERWSIEAAAGAAPGTHVLNVELTAPITTHLDVVKGIANHVASYHVSLSDRNGVPCLRFNAELRIDIREVARALTHGRYVGEHGPELVDLPVGAQVKSTKTEGGQ